MDDEGGTANPRLYDQNAANSIPLGPRRVRSSAAPDVLKSPPGKTTAPRRALPLVSAAGGKPDSVPPPLS